MIEVIPKEETTCQDDTIYRQAALNALCTPNGILYPIRTIENLPPAQSEPQWIPCNKRLPKGRELVNVSCHDDSGDTSYDYSSCGWVTDDGEYWIVDNEINNFVVAWMPLPKSWKGEQDALN